MVNTKEVSNPMGAGEYEQEIRGTNSNKKKGVKPNGEGRAGQKLR